jgi:hypothetical protein
MRFALTMLTATVLGFQTLAQAEMAAPVSDMSGRESATVAKDEHPDLHPDLSPSAPWAGQTARGILLIFLAAAVVGPKPLPQSEPSPSHDDAHGGASHH